jgi:predicted DNA-binding transcriptional regulator YafY
MEAHGRLELTEEEAFALLSLTMMSHGKLDRISEQALHKLADYCRHHLSESHHKRSNACELTEAG